MIFVGDIAIPYPNAIKLQGIPKDLFQKNWFGNLEGALISNQNNYSSDIHGVYNSKEAIEHLINDFRYIGFALANNHIFDVGSFEETINYLKHLDIPYCGVGKNIEDSLKPLVLNDKGTEILIVNLGWSVIQCDIVGANKVGVAPLTKQNALQILSEIRKSVNNNVRIIFFMHWSYELEAHPQPRERELARYLIDNGADGIIGTHPHRVGEFELYRGKPIFYSLGNWMFKQNHYFKGKLKFPDFCNMEIAFEWDFKNEIMKIHYFEYNKKDSLLKYISTKEINENFVFENSLFNKLTNQEYKKYYKKNHYHRNKGLPIYYWEDSKYMIKVKNAANKLRDIILKIFINIKLKLK